MKSLIKYEIAIIGGGPAGSTAAIYLKKKGFNVCLIEKKVFPRETLCGEFISKEVLEILVELDLFPKFMELNPNPIFRLKFVDDKKHELKADLGFRGYGIKRGKFDELLLNKAKYCGVDVVQPAEVKGIEKLKSSYELTITTQDSNSFQIYSEKVIGAYGKQNQFDKLLNRKFIRFKSGLNGIKFHMPLSYFPNMSQCDIQIYSSRGIYCGVNAVDDNTVTVCFLEDHGSFQGSSREHLKYLIGKNTAFKNIIDPLVEKFIDSAPIYGVGNIYFGTKSLWEDGIIMIGDAARVIAPLAGDGIAMAMESAKLVSQILSTYSGYSEHETIKQYKVEWEKKFNSRVVHADILQKLILSNRISWPLFAIQKVMPSVLETVIQSTRG